MSNTVVQSPVVLHHIQVSHSDYNIPGIVDLAKSFLEGYNREYFFFQVDRGYYCLILSDDVTSVSVNGSSASFAADNAIVYDIYVNEIDNPITLSYSGSPSGTFSGAQPSPFTGTWSGSSRGSVDFTETSYEYFYTTRTAQNISIYNPSNNLCYSSLDGFPHLIEGVCFYAWAAFALCFGIIAFKLLDRIFRRIY